MMVAGPAGIGKTTLLAAARGAAAAHGVRPLVARGGELERNFPYGVVRQLLERAVVGADDGERRRLLAGAAELAAPALGLAPPPGGGGDAAFAAAHGVYWLCANLAEERPLLLAVDDAHWADGPSQRALAYLARRIGDLPVALLAAARPAEPDPAFARAALRATGGNPLYLDLLAGRLAEVGVAPVASSARAVEEAGGAAVAGWVRRRMAGLPPSPRALAEAVAVLGADAELRHAAPLAGLDPEAAAGRPGARAARRSGPGCPAPGGR